VDGVNTVCFNESSDAFTFGVIGFTRVVTANAAGVSVGGGAPAAFAGQILDSDTLFNNSGQVTLATPSALATSPGAYDLESLLTHELGHYFGLDDSAVRRAILYPFAPPPGTYIGNRPTASAPDGQLADDDRTGLRVLYPDPADTTYVGTIRAGNFPSDLAGCACEWNFRHAGGRGKCRYRRDRRGSDGRLELQSVESGAAVRRVVSD
jgi:hypothetical protein